MKFAMIAEFNPQADVAGTRPAHREYLTKLRDQGNLAISGPFADGKGALIVLEAGSQEEAEQLVNDDPFAKAGCFKAYELRPWNVVFINRSVLPE